MANKIKDGSSYTNPKDTTEDLSATAYGVVTQVNINHNRKDGQVTMEVYPRTCTREERKGHVIAPVGQHGEEVTEELYDEYFAKAKYTNGNNPQKSAYEMLAAVEVEDAEGVVTKKYAEWESDET